MPEREKSLEAAVVALQDLDHRTEDLDPVALQRLLAAAVTAYAARRVAGDQISPFLQAEVPDASSVCLTVSAMLDAVSIEVFELAMWQAWAGATGS
jgi:hypothetical protein